MHVFRGQIILFENISAEQQLQTPLGIPRPGGRGLG